MKKNRTRLAALATSAMMVAAPLMAPPQAAASGLSSYAVSSVEGALGLLIALPFALFRLLVAISS